MYQDPRPAIQRLRRVPQSQRHGDPRFAKPSSRRMENRSRLKFSNRYSILGKNPFCCPSKNLLGRKASRGRDFYRLAFRTSKELPNEGHRFENSLRKTIFQS
jgi:hypothetical protein